MRVSGINTNINFGARLSAETKRELNNEEFAKELEQKIADSKVLQQFDQPDNEVSIVSRERSILGGEPFEMLTTVLTGSLNGEKVEATLNFGNWSTSIQTNPFNTAARQVGKKPYYQCLVLEDIKESNTNEAKIKAQMAKQYVEKYMRKISVEDAARVYDKIANGEY